MWTGLAIVTAMAWLYLVCCHGRFWLASERLPDEPAEPARWPDVVAVVPARDEAECVGAAIESLVTQDYPGRLDVVLVDDESTDGTADRARAAARGSGRGERLTVLPTEPRPAGWVGKMWAVQHGVASTDAALVWLTDADIVHPPGALRELVSLLEDRQLDLASLMVKLDDRAGLERLLIPAFVYFFQLLYPFPRVNDPRAHTAAAAGGCILVRRAALRRAGGIEAVRGEIIDDCALAAAVKAGGPIWLGLGTEARSIRSYAGLRGVWSMVARTAFTQLRHSWLLLADTVVGLGLLFAAGPVLVLTAPLHGDLLAAGLGAAAWIAMVVSFAPTLALYARPARWGAALPLAGVLYTAMTVDSALRHARGRGAEWKGRTHGDAL